MQLGFYFNPSRCTACCTCLIACRDWHEYELGIEPQNWTRISAVERGKFPKLSISYHFITCLHCFHPACEAACPVGAISKRESDGIVTVDRNNCLGGTVCGVCKSACPYDIPQFSSDEDGKMEKCNLCVGRWQAGRKPICVEACPTRALDAGPLDELVSIYRGAREAEGFVYHADVAPSFWLGRR